MSYEIIKASYDRCCESGDFFGTFYDKFMAKSPDVAAKFANTDFKKQKPLIKASVSMMIRMGTGDSKAREAIEKVGTTHSKQQLDIEPKLYDLWLETLCETAAIHDKEWDKNLESLWRERMQEGVKIITSRY